MKREEIKSYKDACKVIGKKPRIYKDKHLNLYEQLSTIIAALNFISNDNKPWTPELDFYYIYTWLYDEINGSHAGLFYLDSYDGLGPSYAPIDTSLRIKEREDGNYIIEVFEDLLQNWFWG